MSFERSRVALITGVTGQDGAYLSELLLAKGYHVHGIKRRSSSFNTPRIDDMMSEHEKLGIPFFLHYGDLTDTTSLIRLMQRIAPDEIYNLGAQSHVAVSFETPEYTANADAVGALRLLEAIRILGMERTARFYQASTSELFGSTSPPQNEESPFHPRSPYAAAKLYAYWIVINYREAYNFYACNGILFNHESPLRGETFVTRKITRAVAAISRGRQDVVLLGNLESKRDWGHARDFVDGMWLMLQQEKASDYVLATGQAYTVRQFVEYAFEEVGIKVEWHGKGTNEVGVDRASGRTIVAVHPRYFRPSEVDHLLGDYSKAQRELGWAPSVGLRELVREMVQADLGLLDTGFTVVGPRGVAQRVAAIGE